MKYTKKQITEAIKYWQKELKRLDEAPKTKEKVFEMFDRASDERKIHIILSYPKYKKELLHRLALSLLGKPLDPPTPETTNESYETDGSEHAAQEIDWLDIVIEDGEWVEGLPLKLFTDPPAEFKPLLKSLSFKQVGEYSGMPTVEVSGDETDVKSFLDGHTNEKKSVIYEDIISWIEDHLDLIEKKYI